MNLKDLYRKALNLEFLSTEEGEYLFLNAPLADLMFVANEIRKIKKKDTQDIVTWQIDRNVNTTNICIASCKFCNFFRPPKHPEGYITTDEEYKEKIRETLELGGDQILLQGGHHPELGIEFYENLFRKIKSWFPEIRLHALGPPEVVHISQLSGLTYEETLIRLKEAGMDSLPGAGAEILSDRVRRLVSYGKCNTREWLDVMRVAHKLNIPTSATMMYGHVETLQERFDHLKLIRDVQAEKPEGSMGFKAFIAWPYQDRGTILQRVKKVYNKTSADENVRMVAISRIMLPNIENIQVSWLTVGPKIAQMCLHAGANDMGSIMIEENVVSAAGASYRMGAKEIQKCILEAGFKPQLRNQIYEFRELPPRLKEIYSLA